MSAALPISSWNLQLIKALDHRGGGSYTKLDSKGLRPIWRLQPSRTQHPPVGCIEIRCKKGGGMHGWVEQWWVYIRGKHGRQRERLMFLIRRLELPRRLRSASGDKCHLWDGRGSEDWAGGCLSHQMTLSQQNRLTVWVTNLNMHKSHTNVLCLY